jgi:polar amino acid transport system substrate-binding protein
MAFLPMLLMAENLIFYAGAPPLSYAEKGRPLGLYFDIVTAVFDDMGVKYQVTAVPFKRALLHAYEGKGIVVGIYKTKERSKKLDYSNSFYESKVVLFVPHKQDFPFSSMTDLTGKTIATKVGWSYGVEFDKARARLDFQAIDGEAEQNFRLVMTGRRDAFIDNHISGITTLRKMGIIDKIQILPRPVNVGSHYLGVKKNTHSQLLKRFNQHLKKLKAEGRYEEILSHYL